jgi:hypothetical protein
MTLAAVDLEGADSKDADSNSARALGDWEIAVGCGSVRLMTIWRVATSCGSVKNGSAEKCRKNPTSRSKARLD